VIKPQVKIAAFNLNRVVGLINSTAFARAAWHHTNLTYERFDSNTVMEMLVQAVTAEPGFASVDQDVRAIELERRKIYAVLVKRAIGALESGPGVFIRYLGELEKSRALALKSVEHTFTDAREINRQISGDLGKAIGVCAGIQLASTLVLVITPVGLTFAGAEAAGAAGMIGFGYSVTKSIAKDLAEAKGAQVIAFDIGKEGAKQVANTRNDKLAEKAIKQIEQHSDLIDEFEEKIEALSASLARKVSSKKIAKLNRQISKAEEAAAGATRARNLAIGKKVASRTLSVAFAAYDVLEAWDDFQKALEDTR
jgi:hypothetical protein